MGQRQVFVRFYGCNLRCSYCDSPETLKETPLPSWCRVEFPPCSLQFHSIPNPVHASILTNTVEKYLAQPHHSIAITGGEPLLHVRFLETWLPTIRSLHLPIFLETNGLLPNHLRQIAAHLNYISMDYKAPSDTGADRQTTIERHLEFLAVAREFCVATYVKLVVTEATVQQDVDDAVSAISSQSLEIPLILQPVTPVHSHDKTVPVTKLLDLQARAATVLKDVRIIPQTHKMLQIL